MFKQKAFTLVELLVYVGIFAVVSGLMIGILTTTLRVNQRESASAEATSQLNFVLQTIQRLTRESSAIIVNSSSTNMDTDDTVGSQQTRLVLRMKDSVGSNSTDRDPIVIYAENNVIKMSEGRGGYQRVSDLTNNRVLADNLKFTKYTQYPGQDTVGVDIQLTYNSQDPSSRATRNLRTAIARVSAATFDSNLLPGTDNTYEIGYSANQRWKNISISNLLNIGTSATEPVGAQNGSIYYNTSTNKFKGYASSTWANLEESFWTASSTDIYRSSGNVGIGTTAPTSLLEVYSNTADTKLTITAATSTDSQIVFKTGATPAIQSVIGIDFSDSNKLKLVGGSDIATSTGITIDSNGNVGIGTTGPGSKLEVAGNIRASLPTGYAGVRVYSYSPALYLQNTETDGKSWQIQSGGAVVSNFTIGLEVDTPKMAITSSGNVGIGTLNPVAKLDVRDAVRVGNASTAYSVGSEYGLYLHAGSDAFAHIGAHNPGSQVGMKFYTTSGGTHAARMTILNDGNVGIGTTAPGNILTIVQNSATDPIADAWTTYSTPESKIVLGTADDKTDIYLEKFKNLPVYKWKRNENEIERLSVLAVESTPSEILAYDKDGKIQGIDLQGYVGFLHEVIKGQQQQIQEQQIQINKLNQRIEILEKK